MAQTFLSVFLVWEGIITASEMEEEHIEKVVGLVKLHLEKEEGVTVRGAVFEQRLRFFERNWQAFEEFGQRMVGESSKDAIDN